MKWLSCFIFLAFVFSSGAYPNDFAGRSKGLTCYDGARKVHVANDLIASSTPYGDLESALSERESGKTGDQKYDFGNDRICVLRDASVKLTCTAGEKVIFQSKYSDIHKFEPERRGFVLQSHNRRGGVSVYTFSPGGVVCTSS